MPNPQTPEREPQYTEIPRSLNAHVLDIAVLRARCTRLEFTLSGVVAIMVINLIFKLVL